MHHVLAHNICWSYQQKRRQFRKDMLKQLRDERTQK
jgi:hypothetical protein